MDPKEPKLNLNGRNKEKLIIKLSNPQIGIQIKIRGPNSPQ